MQDRLRQQKNPSLLIRWSWRQFEDISGVEMHEMLRARQDVFVLEQQCLYPDIDALDPFSWHLFGHTKAGTDAKKLLAYARVPFPTIRFDEPSFGRVLIVRTARGQGYGRIIIEHCIDKCQHEYPDKNIRISAQTYLAKFYSTFGFISVGEQYLEDGIEHVDMLRVQAHSFFS
jgi:ElaA protein